MLNRKPKLYKSGDWWICNDGFHPAAGNSADEAYENWIKNIFRYNGHPIFDSPVALRAWLLLMCPESWERFARRRNITLLLR